MNTTDSKIPPADAAPGRVTFLEGRGELPMMEISTAWSTAEIYLHGAHVTHFQKKNEPPLLFLSQCSRFENGQPIRGGVPVIFPWFGAREGLGQHGFARKLTWELKEVATAADGSVSVRFGLPDCPEAATYPPFLVGYIVTVNEHLSMELMVTNKSAQDKFEFENCLHTYFFVEDIAAVSVSGLQGVNYLDKTENQSQKLETQEAIHISTETDRTYLNTSSEVKIHDARLGRVIRVEKKNSASTVVWNPWIEKAQQMSDFGNEEYRNMICVESGNVGPDKIVLAPRETSWLKVKLGTLPMA